MNFNKNDKKITFIKYVLFETYISRVILVNVWKYSGISVIALIWLK